MEIDAASSATGHGLLIDARRRGLRYAEALAALDMIASADHFRRRGHISKAFGLADAVMNCAATSHIARNQPAFDDLHLKQRHR